MDFVLVPSGTFEQGTPGATDLERPYTATITRNYFVSRTEVTQGQWRAASGETNPSCFQSTTGTECTTGNNNDNGPVENLDWWSAVRYANWLSAQNGFEACYTLTGCSENSATGWYDGDHDAGCTGATFVGQSCTGYRLLTESEWERAARAGTTSVYYWGGSVDPAIMGEYAWYNANSGSRTQAVGGKSPNDYGLYDMSGNVWEWGSDWGDPTGYPVEPSSDYEGLVSGEVRVRRGGSFTSFTFVRSAFRGFDSPLFRDNASGFRLARTVP